jgi:hypothetical protein
MRVVLPAPLAPKNPTSSPSLMEKETLSRALNSFSQKLYLNDLEIS